MVGIRQQAGQNPQSLPILFVAVIPLLLICEVIHGQPNYYFKASAPAVKSLPRIGRRSEEGGSNVASGGGINSGGPPSISFSRTLDLPSGMMEMWPNSGNPVGDIPTSIFGVVPSRNVAMSSNRAPSLIAPNLPSSNQLLEKSALWKRLLGLGELNNYEESLLDNMYRFKT